MHPKDLRIADYTYHLPDERIAAYPVEPRDISKLLVYKNAKIQEAVYKNLADYLPENSSLVFNDTKVIKSRILFRRATGAKIELFCLEPYEEFADYAKFFQQKHAAVWKCFVGNANKWKENFLLKEIDINGDKIQLKAELLERIPGAFAVRLSWEEDYTLAEVIEAAGKTPLPPYIKREAEEKDEDTYQTIYSEHEGSVAAPTAGLHFTEDIMHSLEEKNIQKLFATLHVGAGTFKPVSSETMVEHIMHAEYMHIEKDFVLNLSKALDQHIFSVGTTATRTLESLYWMGNKILNQDINSIEELVVGQWESYENQTEHKPKESLEALANWMQSKKIEELQVPTEIIIAPGYTYKIISGIITNFHQPQSTLLLLVAALIGEDWKEIYDYALKHDFRFLSYGDGCLLFPKTN